MDGVFVTGTDTDVGKTLVSGGLLKMFEGSRHACYWKPVQTGTIIADDTKELQRLLAYGEEKFWEPVYRFTDPLSPHLAAAKWKKKISLDTLVSKFDSHRESFDGFTIVEGAGGLLVPLTDEALQIELIKRLRLPTIIVAEDRLGAINQTLLTINACREDDIVVLGVVMTKSSGQFGNADSIARFGRVEILAEIEKSDDTSLVLTNVSTRPGLRKLFKLPVIPEV